jgi:hypothetical protein
VVDLLTFSLLQVSLLPAKVKSIATNNAHVAHNTIVEHLLESTKRIKIDSAISLAHHRTTLELFDPPAQVASALSGSSDTKAMELVIQPGTKITTSDTTIGDAYHQL